MMEYCDGIIDLIKFFAAYSYEPTLMKMSVIANIMETLIFHNNDLNQFFTNVYYGEVAEFFLLLLFLDILT